MQLGAEHIGAGVQRMLMEESLRESERRLELGIWGGDLALWEWQPERDVVAGNPRLAELLELPDTHPQLSTSEFLERLHPEDRERVRAALEDHRLGGSPFLEIEHRIGGTQGGPRWVLARGKAVARDASGRALRVTGIWQDISERRRAEEQRASFEAHLRETQKLESLGLLAGGIAHDFNNLLTVVHGFADLALVRLPAESDARPVIERIAQTVTRMAELTNQMLAYSGRGKFDIRRIDLNHFVRETADFLKVSVTKKASLRFELSTVAPWIEADIAQARQVLLNLITNASEALPGTGGTITVRTGSAQLGEPELSSVPWRADLKPGDYAFFEVSDNGCGMSPETLARIFEPFFTTKFTGRGLGLSAVQGIVRAHGGAIRIESAPGAGTTFRILMPACTPSQVPGEGSPAELSARTERGRCVLVVDDEEALQQVITGFLEALGYAWRTASDGLAGLDTFRKEPECFDAVLLDLTMPGMGGVEVLAEIKALRPRMPVLLMSGYAEQEVGRLLSDGRCAGFLSKPFRLKQLAEKLERALASVPGRA